MSWNVNGIRAVAKKGFVDIVKSLNPSILAIQETKAQKDQLDDTIINIDGYYSFWHSAKRKGYSSVACYTKIKPKSVIDGVDAPIFDDEGRVLTLEFEDFYLVNCYFPNAQHDLLRIDYKLAFNTALLDFTSQLRKTKSVVICGDYNVAHKAIDLKNPKSNEKNPGYSEPERAWMDAFIAAGFTDTFRLFNQDPGHYTWWSYRFQARARNIGWRIDYFCVDSPSQSRVSASIIHPDILGSDHCPISISFT